jgi:transcription antitermination factor NusB
VQKSASNCTGKLNDIKIRGPAVDKRTRARELAMQGLYQLEVQGTELLERIDDFFAENSPEEISVELASKWCKETWQRVAECDKLIGASTIKWGLSRLSLVDKSILRLAVYQLKFCDDIPPKVVINEAIELAKKYSGEKSPSFINGVLDAALRKIEKSGVKD